MNKMQRERGTERLELTGAAIKLVSAVVRLVLELIR